MVRGRTEVLAAELLQRTPDERLVEVRDAVGRLVLVDERGVQHVDAVGQSGADCGKRFFFVLRWVLDVKRCQQRVTSKQMGESARPQTNTAAFMAAAGARCLACHTHAAEALG
jgi:hypothetical protein